MALNTQKKAPGRHAVRQALNYATDREALVRTQLRGFGTPANSPLAPADFAYDPQTRGYPYDLERAKALLAKAGYGNGFALKIAVQEADAQLVEALQGMWAKIHVNLEIDQMENGVFSQAIFGSPKQKASKGSIASLLRGPRITPILTTSWTRFIEATNGLRSGANLGFYANPHLDVVLESAAAELDAEKRKALYQRGTTNYL